MRVVVTVVASVIVILGLIVLFIIQNNNKAINQAGKVEQAGEKHNKDFVNL